ncbi:MAG: hypothetical protein JWO69_1409 [Thermoleophilia bacterium]|jgi:ferritin-like metal-binding protein YciE|nr:hypothetical protein [Thermoleophilia bacterium]
MDTDAHLQESVITHLQQMHASERAQAAELRVLRDEVGIASVAAILDQHHSHTRRHGDLVEARLRELDSGPSMRLLAQSFAAAAPKTILDRVRPHDARACVRDAVLAEAGEIAGYLLVELEAIRAGDASTGVLAAEIRADEVATRDELMSHWETVVEHDLDRIAGRSATRDARAELIDHLRDVYALERNAVIMLTTVLGTVRDDVAVARIEDHRHSTERRADELLHRLHELGSAPSVRKQAQAYAFAAMKGPINFLRAERAGKDMRDMYVVDHMEQVAYAQLEIIAEHAGDERTHDMAIAHRAEDAAMADWLERDAARFLLETHGMTTPS